MMAFKVRFPLLLLLGVVFLALVCASASAISSHEGREGLPPRHRESGGQRERAHQEGEREEERRYQPRHHKSQSEEQEEDEEEERQPHHRPQHKREEDEGRHQREREEEDEEDEEGQQHYRPRRHQREREDEEEDQQQRNPRRGQEEEDEEEEEREHGAGRRHRRSRQHAGEREEEQRPSRHRGRGREEDEDEDEEEDRRPEERERRRRRESERHRGGRQRRSRESEEDDDEEEGSSSEERRNNNPFLFRSNRFQTLLKNENGQIRLLQRFDKRSNLFENLQNYRLLEYRSKPNTLLLPQHYDADFILVVLRGKAILTVVNPKERNSFNLERGDAIKIPAGTLAYLANRDNEQDLRVVDLAIPVNRPGQFQPFNPSSSENQQSYFRGFSKDILEASFNTNIEEIERVLLEEQQQDEQSHGQGRREQRRGRKERHQQQEQEGQDEANNNPIVRVSREQIEELSKNAKSSSKKKSESSKSEPFNLRSRDPIYSNKFGQFFQITPKQSPQLKDLDLYLTSVKINEGALLLPHYNSRGTVILVINEGKGNIELVGVRNEQQQEEEEEDEDDQRSRQVKRYRARVSPGDVFIVPSSHPVAIKASSNLSFVGFGINAENNQRNFLAGEEDNVISQIHKPVKELAFPGSAQDVDKLIKNQKQSYFANARPEQKEGQKRSRGPLSSILGAFY